jgi:tetratricopeptide (TPR) repeat protein
MDPTFALAHFNLYDTYLAMGRNEDSMIADKVTEVYGRSGFHAALVENAELLKQLAKHRYVDPGHIGYRYATLGDKDQAFAWLEKAYAEKADSLQYIKTEFAVDALRTDPRYAELLKRMELPQ